MVPILSTQKVQWAWEIEFSPVGWNTVVLCFSQIRPLVCVGGATEGKRSPQMFCLDTAKKTRFPASDRNIVVAFFVTWRVENGVAVLSASLGSDWSQRVWQNGKMVSTTFFVFFAVP